MEVNDIVQVKLNYHHNGGRLGRFKFFGGGRKECCVCECLESIIFENPELFVVPEDALIPVVQNEQIHIQLPIPEPIMAMKIARILAAILREDNAIEASVYQELEEKLVSLIILDHECKEEELDEKYTFIVNIWEGALRQFSEEEG